MALSAVKASGQTGYVLEAGYPSGGVAYGLNPDGTSSSIPYAMSQDSYGGANGGGASSSCSGQTTWTWTWQGSGPPPDNVIVAVYANAGYNSISGSCDDGYHDPVQRTGPPPPAPPSGGSTSGTHYLIYHAPGSSFSLQLTPSATSGPGNSWASVAMELTDVTVSTSGGLYPGTGRNKDECLPGQYNRSSIAAGGYLTPASNPQWTITGPGSGPMAAPDWGGTPPPLPSSDTYVSPPRHVWVPLSSQSGQTTTAYFWSRDGTATATCSATAFDPSGNAIGPITGKYELQVKDVDHRLTKSYGTTTRTFDNPGNLASITSGQPGMSFWCYALTPIEYERPAAGGIVEGNAWFAPAQLIDSKVSITGTTAGFPASASWDSGGFALDNQFPYDYPLTALLFAPINFPSGTAQATDTPMVGLEPPFTISESYDINDQFEMFLTFVGPTVSGMPNAEYVPLEMLNWQWINADSAPWAGTPRDPQGELTTEWPIDQFQWTTVFSNSGS